MSLFQTLPIVDPTYFFNLVCSVFIRFVWTKRHPGLSYAYLAIAKTHRGMAFPYPLRYYQAAHLARVLGWCRDKGHKAWVSIKKFSMRIPLQCLMWLRPRTLRNLRHHPLIGATLRVVSKSGGEITGHSHLTILIADLNTFLGKVNVTFATTL